PPPTATRPGSPRPGCRASPRQPGAAGARGWSLGVGSWRFLSLLAGGRSGALFLQGVDRGQGPADRCQLVGVELVSEQARPGDAQAGGGLESRLQRLGDRHLEEAGQAVLFPGGRRRAGEEGSDDVLLIALLVEEALRPLRQ